MIHIGFVNQIIGSKQKITLLTLIYKKNLTNNYLLCLGSRLWLCDKGGPR